MNCKCGKQISSGECCAECEELSKLEELFEEDLVQVEESHEVLKEEY